MLDVENTDNPYRLGGAREEKKDKPRTRLITKAGNLVLSVLAGAVVAISFGVAKSYMQHHNLVRHSSAYTARIMARYDKDQNGILDSQELEALVIDRRVFP